MRGTCRRQDLHGNRNFILEMFLKRFKSELPVHKYGSNVRVSFEQTWNIVGQQVPNGAVQCAGSHARSNDIPQRQMVALHQLFFLSVGGRGYFSE